MDEQKIKEYVIRMEGLLDGFKQGTNQTIKWLVDELAAEAELRARQETPAVEPESGGTSGH